MKSTSSRLLAMAAFLGLALGILPSPAQAQSYLLKKLTSDVGGAKHTDALLQNAWGLVYGPSQPFWVSDENDGWSTLYDGAGNPQTLQVIVPTHTGSGSGSPSGIAYNGSSQFQIETWPSAFLFATIDGSIQGWSHFNRSSSLVAVDNHAKNAVYTGIAVTARTSGNFLYVANFHTNLIEMYDGNFSFVKSFTDSKIPKGFSTFNVQDINGMLYVSFAATNGGAGGYVDVFSENGTLVKQLIHGKPLNKPWGFAMAPQNFGPLSNTLLVGNDNNLSSTISGFNPTTGALVGTITNSKGKPIKIDQLWGIEFGGGSASNGKTNALYFTAGPNNGSNGLFGVITFK
jgi:uncharacterized protein (TIGR03118 family)